MTLLRTRVAVWLDRTGAPQRMVWHGERYRVTDTPTPLQILLEEHVTHAPVGTREGWRFQGTNEAGESRIFDIRRDGDELSWILVGTYE